MSVTLKDNLIKGWSDFISVNNASLKILANRWKSIGLILAFPLILYFVITELTPWLSKQLQSSSSLVDYKQLGDSSVVIWLIIFEKWLSLLIPLLPSVLASCLLVINIHRAVILKQGLKMEKGWLNIFLKFIWASLIIFCVYIVFISPFFYFYVDLKTSQFSVGFILKIIFWVFWFFLGGYVLARSSLMLPAASIGSPSSLKISWKLSSNNGVLMVFVVLFLPILLTLVYRVFLMLPLPALIQKFISYGLTLSTFLIEVTFLSVSYFLILKRHKARST